MKGNTIAMINIIGLVFCLLEYLLIPMFLILNVFLFFLTSNEEDKDKKELGDKLLEKQK